MTARAHRRKRDLDRFLGEGEHVLLDTKQHPFALVGETGRTLLLLTPLLIAAWGVAGIELMQGAVGAWTLRGMFLIMIGIVMLLAWRVLQWEVERVVVTDEKVIHMSGVLHRKVASTPLAKASEFAVHQPVLGRLFDYGALIVDVPGGRDQALHGVRYLPDPAGVYRLVSDRARGRRMAEGGAAHAPAAVPTSAAMPTPMPDVEPAPRLYIDPWTPGLQPDSVDHTIVIPRIDPNDVDARATQPRA
jgi:hypothetical protein